jgi:lipopolysaccharide transport system permease protein
VTATSRPTVITPPGRGRGRGLGLRELWDYRSVVAVLTRRNLMVRYRQTVVGIAWVVLQPLALTAVLSIAFSLLDRFGSPGVPFPVFYLSAFWLWVPMTKVINEGTNSILANLELVTRVYVPRALIPLSVAAATMVDLVIEFAIFIGFLLLFGFPPSPLIVLTPVLLAIGYTTVIGMTYFLAAVNTRYRDAQLALPFLVQMWFFASPIIYPTEWIPESLQPFYYLNPMALVITASRWVFAGLPAPPAYAWAEASIVAVLFLIGGYLYFRSQEPTFADDL